MDLREVGCDAGDCIVLTQGRDQWQAYGRYNEPPGSLKAN